MGKFSAKKVILSKMEKNPKTKVILSKIGKFSKKKHYLKWENFQDKKDILPQMGSGKMLSLYISL